MSLIDAIPSLATGTYTVTRTPARNYTAGVLDAPTGQTTFSVIASAQPPTGRDLQQLPDGVRADEVRIVYAREELKTTEPGYEPDTISIDGNDYEVFRVETWQAFGEAHRRTWTRRVEVA